MERRIAIMTRGDTACVETIRGVRRYAARRAGWVVRAADAKTGLARLNRILKWQPDAMIFAGRYNRTLEKIRVAVPGPVICTYRPDFDTPTVCVDHRAVGRLLAEHLLETGLRHLAYFQQQFLSFDSQCAEGFAKRVEEAGLAPIVVPPLDAEHEAREIDDSVYLGAIDKLPKPIGIATCSDENALRISDVCASNGVAIPDDVVLVGVGNERRFCEACTPTLSSVAVPYDEIGYRAAELVDRGFRGKKLPRRAILLPPIGIVERGSCDILATVHDPLVAKALRFLQEHLADQVTVENLLDHLVVSRRKLELRFREVRGRTPRAELERMRVLCAKRLLSETLLDMPAIARQCGFGSASRFSMVFSKVVGEPPTQYRKRSR